MSNKVWLLLLVCVCFWLVAVWWNVFGRAAWQRSSTERRVYGQRHPSDETIYRRFVHGIIRQRDAVDELTHDGRTSEQAAATVLRWEERVVNRMCSCHSGSVCSVACQSGYHHAGCPLDGLNGIRQGPRLVQDDRPS